MVHWSYSLENVGQLVATDVLYPLIAGILNQLVPAKQSRNKEKELQLCRVVLRNNYTHNIIIVLPFLVCQRFQLDFRVIEVAESQQNASQCSLRRE